MWKAIADAHRAVTASHFGAVRTSENSDNDSRNFSFSSSNFVITYIFWTIFERHFNLSRTRHRLAPVPTYRGGHNSDAEGQIAAEIVPSPQLQLIE